MIFKYEKKTNLIMVYGFSTKKKFYDMVMTIVPTKSTSWIYGFLTKALLLPIDFRKLFSLIQKIVPTKTITLEVMPEHAALYKRALHLVSIKQTKTFDGFNCEILVCDIKKGLKI